MCGGVCLFLVAVGVGALIGGGMEYGFQVAANYQRGLTGWNAWSQIHHNEVMIAAMGGGVAGGVGFFFAPVLAPIARLGRFGRVVTGGIEGMVSDVSATVVVSGVTRQGNRI